MRLIDILIERGRADSPSSPDVEGFALTDEERGEIAKEIPSWDTIEYPNKGFIALFEGITDF